jgi:hypothetical protein
LKQKVEGKGMRVGEHREQELKRLPDLLSELFVLARIGLDKLPAMTCLHLEQPKSHRIGQKSD